MMPPRAAVLAVAVLFLPACGKSSDSGHENSGGGTGSGTGAELEGFVEGVGDVTALEATDESQAYCKDKNLGTFVKKPTSVGFDYLLCLGNWPLVIKNQTFTAANLAFKDHPGMTAKHYAGFFTFSKGKSSTAEKPDFGVLALTYVGAKGLIDVNYVFGYGGDVHIDVAADTKGLPFKFTSGATVEVKSVIAGTIKPVDGAKSFDITFTEMK